MLELKNVDLICVDGRERSGDVYTSLQALDYTANLIKFNKIKFISYPLADVQMKIRNYHVDFQHIGFLDLQQYNEFFLNKVADYVESGYAMFVQWDGFVVNPQLWEEQFLAYDYIGAPWPPNWPNRRSNRVGNGGFSIRSKRLIERCRTIDVPSHYGIPEDNIICINMRQQLECEGFTFAPPDVASRFSWENPTPENGFGATFGFHGRHPFVEQYHAKLEYGKR